MVKRKINIVNSFYTKSVLLSLFQYIKKPKYRISYPKRSVGKKVWDILNIWSFVITLVLVIGVIVSKILDLLGYDQMQNTLVELMDGKAYLTMAFLAIFWAPLVEEFTFRMILKYSLWSLSVGFSMLVLVFIEVLIISFNIELTFLHNYKDKFGLIPVILLQVLIVLLIFSSVHPFLKKYLNEKKAKRFYKKYFHYIFFTSAIAFSSVHILNYYNFAKIWYALPLLVVPQFLVAIVLGYIRMEYGLKWSIFLHFWHNFVLTVPLILFYFIQDYVKKGLGPDLEMIRLIDRNLVVLVIFLLGFSLMITTMVLVLLFNSLTELVKNLRRGMRI